MKTNEPASMAIDCPECSAKAAMVEHVQDIPHFGKILISSLSCQKCGFRLNDVMAYDAKSPAGYKAKIEKEKDLETKVVRSSSGTVRIPQLGISIEPGPSAEGYITNIEGILDRMEQVMKLAIGAEDTDVGAKDEKRIARKELQRLKDARKAMFSFEVIIEDPFGNSALIGDKVKKFSLSPEEIMQLKRNLEVLDLGEEDE
ncbi:MAG: ZPR1 zinc finger domain-containing protein [archaeon]